MNKLEWNFKHVACPHCGNVVTNTTNIGVAELGGEYEDNINGASCDCGWKGMVSELVPAKTGDQTSPLPVKMLDFDGKTYGCLTDVVTVMLDYNKKLGAHLTEDQATFTTALFTEIAKMFITLDKQHWVNKYNAVQEIKQEEADTAKEKLEHKTAQAGSPAEDVKE